MKKIIPFLFFISCINTEDTRHMNELSKSTSPYLLQHAKNPVHWKEWSQEALSIAKEEDKPIIVSIGYSSCHWCHVMEKESFEDSTVARLMNENFINIKVDREERPDVDQVYMDAVQTMGLRGGWPLNVLLTPDQKPFYGGTYFPKEGWINLLNSITEAFENKREKINESAEAFTKNLQLEESKKYSLKGTAHQLSGDEVNLIYNNLSSKFDSINGGVKKSPKFPMPSVWQYLAVHHLLTNDQKARGHFEFTLEKIADGGIYDHIGGGFARYSTDEEWHIPHFEKMLYDNGQLLSLYANGFKISKNQKFEEVIRETVEWLSREMLDESGGFYSALDADSEGEEGKFYVWQNKEIKDLAKENYGWLAEYFDVREEGNWEHKNVLRSVIAKDKIAEKFNIPIDEVEVSITAFKRLALLEREKRVRPGLDHKIIAGWNGLTLTGLSDAYQAIQDSLILDLARKNAKFIKTELIKDGILNRFPNKEMEGFMEDYAAVIQSFIRYYETTLDRDYLNIALKLVERVDEHFYDEHEKLYYFTGDKSQALIARKKELFDNVIPSSNSIMARNLIHLGTHLYRDELVEKGKAMIANVKELIIKEPEYMSNWALSALEITNPMAEIIIVGPNADDFINKINTKYIPNKIIAGTTEHSNLPPFTNKSMINNETTIYVCYDKTCQLPVTTLKKALNQL